MPVSSANPMRFSSRPDRVAASRTKVRELHELTKIALDMGAEVIGPRLARAEAEKGEFGSGWARPALDRDDRLRVASSSDAENPLHKGHAPLLATDVWEHAFYLDYQNRRAESVEAVIDHLLDWGFAASNLELIRGGEGNRGADRRSRESAAASSAHDS